MIQNRTCRECGRQFDGGPRAYYCPSCRLERDRATAAKYRLRKRNGDARPIGSLDKCERCHNDFTVNGGLQRFCPDCQIAHKLEHDMSRAMPKYESNKSRLNPIRNERRRVGLVKCVWCEKEFDSNGTRRNTCSDECRRNHNRRWQRERRKKLRL